MSGHLITEHSQANNIPEGQEDLQRPSQPPDEPQGAPLPEDAHPKEPASNPPTAPEERDPSDASLKPPEAKIAKPNTETPANSAENPEASQGGSLPAQPEGKVSKRPRHYKPRAKKDGTKPPKTPKPKKTAGKEEKAAKKAAKTQKEIIEEVEKSLRRKNSINQASLLEKMFELNSNPSHEVKKAISLDSGLKLRQVQIWFQNRRAKLRRDIAALVEKEPPEYVNRLLDIPEGMPPLMLLPPQSEEVPAPRRWMHVPSEEEARLLSMLKRSQPDIIKKMDEAHMLMSNPLFSEESEPPFLSLLAPMPETPLSETSLHIMVRQADEEKLKLSSTILPSQQSLSLPPHLPSSTVSSTGSGITTETETLGSTSVIKTITIEKKDEEKREEEEEEMDKKSVMSINNLV